MCIFFLPDNLVLDEKQYANKIYTYLVLHKVGCPVLKSVLIKTNKDCYGKKLQEIKEHLNSDKCTVRYQYIAPCMNPRMGGERVQITQCLFKEKSADGAFLWLLEPVDRISNLYGINIWFHKLHGRICLEIVGRGFDVSDINRGIISPHEQITLDFPRRKGYYNEWWKFASFSFVSEEQFGLDKQIRLMRLYNLGYKNISNNIFDKVYKPIPLCLLDSLLKYIDIIGSSEQIKEESFVVSCTVDHKNSIIFWDIQITKEKMFILGGQNGKADSDTVSQARISIMGKCGNT